ncbi:MAG: hypothetical protein Kow0031_05960 [Anaerolineae bacterium]
MTDSLFDTARYVQFGIDAARAGKKTEAREYLKLALQQDPDYVPALFWMAFVAPSPQDSITYLGRILTLEPDNERAKAGLRWARQQLGRVKPAAEPEQATDPAPEADDDPELNRDDFLSHDEIQKRAEKGVKAHRARRNINPLLAVLLLLGATALLVMGVWAVAFVPPDTLAAWLPTAAPAEPPPAPLLPASDAPAAPENSLAAAPRVLSPADGNRPSNFTRQADTLPIEPAAGAETTALEVPSVKPAEPAPALSAPEAAPPTVPNILPGWPDAPTAAPSELFGPVGEAVIGYKLHEPVDESLLAYQPASPDEKWIEVDVTRQIVVAWEGNTPVMAFLSSTGLPGTPTVLGHYNIYWKLESTLMTGPGYYLPDVPYTMYFYGGYALHGAYWHDSFGQPMSHGCVNLRNDNAKKLFEWAGPVVPEGQTEVTSSADNPGTLVVVHE